MQRKQVQHPKKVQKNTCHPHLKFISFTNECNLFWTMSILFSCLNQGQHNLRATYLDRIYRYLVIEALYHHPTSPIQSTNRTPPWDLPLLFRQLYTIFVSHRFVESCCVVPGQRTPWPNAGAVESKCGEGNRVLELSRSPWRWKTWKAIADS